MSNLAAREEWRRHSIISRQPGPRPGPRLHSYTAALRALVEILREA